MIEFFVAILDGLRYLRDSAMPPIPWTRIGGVAREWAEPRWADYSGVSRTLRALTQENVSRIVATLNGVSRPFIEREVALALRDKGRLVYDGDLLGWAARLAVRPSSRRGLAEVRRVEA